MFLLDFSRDTDDSEGTHRLPASDIVKDVMKAVRSLSGDLFMDIGRHIHPIKHPKPLFKRMDTQEKEKFRLQLYHPLASH